MVGSPCSWWANEMYINRISLHGGKWDVYYGVLLVSLSIEVCIFSETVSRDAVNSRILYCFEKFGCGISKNRC